MVSATSTHASTSQAAIFARIWEADSGRLPVQLARHILKLGFAEKDKARMHELAVRNQEGRLLPEEIEELDNYIKVGDMLALLQSKARKLLKRQ